MRKKILTLDEAAISAVVIFFSAGSRLNCLAGFE